MSKDQGSDSSDLLGDAASGVSSIRRGIRAGRAVAEAAEHDPSILANPLHVAGVVMSDKLESAGNGIAKGLEAVGDGVGNALYKLFEGDK